MSKCEFGLSTEGFQKQLGFNARPKLRFLENWGSDVSDFWSAGVLKKYPP